MSTYLKFNKTTFLKLLFSCTLLNAFWTFASPHLKLLHEEYYGVITGIGFLLIYVVTFFIALPKKKRTLMSFVIFCLLFSAIFFVSIFLITPKLIIWTHLLPGNTNSALVGILTVFAIKKYFSTSKFMMIIILPFVFIGAFAIGDLFILSEFLNTIKTGSFEYLKDLAQLQGMWQVIITLLIALGISIKENPSQ